ncbi:Per1-like-domain-containing protein [Chytridium lagenaria]|nr:Per1-like-domain-containing protein [Chytridium lagenaria]
MLFLPWIVFALMVSWSHTAVASSGDRQSLYINCVSKCQSAECHRETPKPLPLILRMTFWDCPQDCKYRCMHQVTAINFHGKWPFVRILGMQEPASVLFSIFNGVAHYYGYKRLARQVPRTSKFRKYYLINALLAVNGWVWSVIFHTRDFNWTEKMDYFTALASITFACFVAVLKTTGSLVLGSFHLPYHVLSFWPFDYTYNMIAGVTLGLAGNQRPYGWKIILTVISISLAMLFEVLDFPPIWWTFDAHSLWHGLLAIDLLLPWVLY